MYFNGLIGTGATQQALYIQLSCVALYLIYIYVVIRWLKAGLVLAWSAEIFYWLVVLVISLWYLYKGKWHSLKV
jgi:Na+-driven multidrug efflux pump